MDHSIIYTGCFIKYRELKRKTKHLCLKHLDRVITTPHITFEYHPNQIDRTLFGEKVKITVTGYGNNGRNEGLKVTLRIENPILNEIYERIEVPHITLSVSNDSKSVDTKDLLFEEIEPFELTGVFGGLNDLEKVELKP